MDGEQISSSLLLIRVGVVLALALFSLGVRRNNLALKQIAVALGVVPMLVSGWNIAYTSFGWDVHDFRTSMVVGSWERRSETSVTDKTTIPVTNAERKHQLVLTAKTWGGLVTTQSVRMHYTLQSPKGEILATGEQDLAPTQKLRWQPLRVDFQPQEEGDHQLILEIPRPVGSVDMIVRELRK